MSGKQDDIFNISVTELLLIIMFSLLVAMVVLNSTLQNKVDKNKKEFEEYTRLISELTGVNSKLGLKHDNMGSKNIEVNEAVAQMQALVKALKKSVESKDAQQVLAKMKLNDIWTTLSKINKENIDIPELLITLKDLNKKLTDCLAINDEFKADLKKESRQVNELKKQLDMLKIELASKDLLLNRVKEDNINLTGQVSNLSNGLEFPPCWATEDGKAEYTYLISVHDDDLEVTSVYPESRREDYFSLISKDFNKKRIPLNTFKKQLYIFYTSALSRTPECRFFVQVKDKTSLDSKMEWKLGLRALESIFYKYELE